MGLFMGSSRPRETAVDAHGQGRNRGRFCYLSGSKVLVFGPKAFGFQKSGSRLVLVFARAPVRRHDRDAEGDTLTLPKFRLCLQRDSLRSPLIFREVCSFNSFVLVVEIFKQPDPSQD